LHCTYDPDSRSGSGSEASQRKVKGTLHWVSAKHAISAEVRLYDRLFNDEAPDGHKDKDYKDFINPESLKIIKNCKLEPSLKNVESESKYQFQRIGYFCVDKKDSKPGALVFNRTVPLKDSWSKIQNKE
jgi:glutaminyl-tRNA synthetase